DARGAPQHDETARTRGQSTGERIDRALESRWHGEPAFERTGSLACEQQAGGRCEAKDFVRPGAWLEHAVCDERRRVLDRGGTLDAVRVEQQVDQRGGGIPLRRVVVRTAEDD